MRNVKEFTCIYGIRTADKYILGERERAPHLWINCMFIWYVRIPYMYSALFVRDAIFPHVDELSYTIPVALVSTP